MNRLGLTLVTVSLLSVAPSAVVAAPPQSIGSFNGGRLEGGQRFADEGADHYLVYPAACYREAYLRGYYPSLERADNNVAHPAVRQAVLDALAEARARHPEMPKIPLGESSNAAGGEIFRHISHQNGLDVDIYFPWAAGRTMCTLEPPSAELKTDAGWTVPATFDRRWSWAIAERFAARADVKIILIGTLVRKALHTWAKANGVPARTIRKTMRKLHPVFCRAPKGVDMGTYRNNRCPHDDHFHVRFRCPKGSKKCSNRRAR